MIDIDKLARESGASLSHDDAGIPEWWVISPDELQLYTEKVMLAAQQAERERAKELVEALETIKRDAPIRASAYITANAAINEYNGEK
jgi:hypothetical protein